MRKKGTKRYDPGDTAAEPRQAHVRIPQRQSFAIAIRAFGIPDLPDAHSCKRSGGLTAAQAQPHVQRLRGG